MAKRLTINVGFITNSSSCVHFFPKALFMDPSVQAFLSAYDLQNGFVGNDLWHRAECTSLLVTQEQKAKAQADLNSSQYSGGPTITCDDETVVVIYGDEYDNVAREVNEIMCALAEKQGLSVGYGHEYN